MHFRKTLIAVLLFFLFSGALINLNADKKKKPVKYPEVKCDFLKIGEIFSWYNEFFPEIYYAEEVSDWKFLEGKRRCEDVLQFILEKERKRWRYDLDIITPKEGITTGYLIAYGQYIEPPYKITLDYEKKRVTINNVQVYPVLEPLKIDKSGIESIQLENRIYEIWVQRTALDKELIGLMEEDYKRLYQGKVIKYGKKRTLAFLKELLDEDVQEHQIKSYRLTEEPEFSVEIAGWYYEPPPNIPPLSEEHKRRFEEFEKRETVKWYQKIVGKLKNGEICLISNSYSTLTTLRTLKEATVIKLAQNLISSEGDFHRAVILNDLRENNDFSWLRWGPVPFPSLKELVFNYSLSNWRTLLSRIEVQAKKR